MKNTILGFCLACAVMASLTPATALHAGFDQANDVAAIASKDVPVTNLSMDELRKIMTGDRQFWKGSQRITVLIRAPKAHERDVILKKVYKKDEGEYYRFWQQRRYADQVNPPIPVSSNQQAIDRVEKNSGAIAFVKASEVPKGTKIVSIDGHQPGDQEYPLR